MDNIPNLSSQESTVQDFFNNTNTDMTNSKNTSGISKAVVVVAVLLVTGLGVLTGYFASGSSAKSQNLPTGVVDNSQITKGSEFGAADTSAFKDNATGVVQKGGVNGEGTHQLLRDGGPSQTVALTSSVLDLDQFVGKKVQVWGQTQQSQKAGWFMDVGKLKILE